MYMFCVFILQGKNLNLMVQPHFVFLVGHLSLLARICFTTALAPEPLQLPASWV